MPERADTVKIGYFGQINPFKGVDTLLEALSRLRPEVRKRVHVGLHGANLEAQTEDFENDIAD